MTSFFNRLSNVFESAKTAWQAPSDQSTEEKLPENFTIPPVKVYYVDTMSKAGEENPIPVPPPPPSEVHKGRLDTHFDKISEEMDAELANGTPNFDKLQTMIYKVIMMMMRIAAKADIEQIQEFTITIKKQAYEIKGTYNKWEGVTITVFSAGISMFGGAAGLSPFAPSFIISADTVQKLVAASHSIGTAGTGLQSIGPIFDKNSEADRSVMQTFQRIIQEKEEERKSGKQSNNDHMKNAKNAAEEVDRQKHQSFSTMANG